MHSSVVTPVTGTNGQTSVAPIRGCDPLCLLISISSEAFFIELNAAFLTASGEPIKVTTVRFISKPGSTSSSFTPSTFSISSVICFIISDRCPSEKLGTHSISFSDMILSFDDSFTKNEIIYTKN